MPEACAGKLVYIYHNLRLLKSLSAEVEELDTDSEEEAEIERELLKNKLDKD